MSANAASGLSDPIVPDEVTRTEVRPGLTMIRRRTLKPDGRYLLFYDFEREGEPAGRGDGELRTEE